ncbi:hypothetical protein LINPERHAP1_LOCUS28127 [Linum perenne]
MGGKLLVPTEIHEALQMQQRETTQKLAHHALREASAAKNIKPIIET